MILLDLLLLFTFLTLIVTIFMACYAFDPDDRCPGYGAMLFIVAFFLLSWIVVGVGIVNDPKKQEALLQIDLNGVATPVATVKGK